MLQFCFHIQLAPLQVGEPFWDYVLQEVRRRATTMGMSQWNPPVITGRGLHSFPIPFNFSLLCPFPLNFSLLCPHYDPN